MGKKKITLSIALAVINEEGNIRTCLSSVMDVASEIVVVDGGSSDKTVETAKEFGARVIQANNPPIFHINKQKALDACKGMWILQLDADEVVTDPLKKEIKEIVNQEPRMKNKELINGYYIPRRNYFLGKWLKKGGQYPDFVIRLIKRGYAFFPCKSVHEQIEVTGKVGYFHEPLLHYSYNTIPEYWRKADIYTDLTAQELYEKKVRIGISSWLVYTLIKPTKTFWSLYIRHKGFLDGWRGFLFAFYSSLHFPIAYRKFRKLHRANS